MSKIIQTVINAAHADPEHAEEVSTEDAATQADTSGDFIDRRFDPHWIPTPLENRELLLQALKAEIMKHVKFTEADANEFWNRFKYDDASHTVEIRPEFKNTAGAVSFHFGEGPQLKEISGPGVNDLHIIKEVEMTHEPSPFEIPDPYAIPRLRR